MQQDPTAAFHHMKPPPQFPEQEQLKCPRCDSSNTKFCYYNNYNLSQPRHFCKNCRRYWTKGGALRNIPVGGGTRKNTKRSPSATSSSSKRSNPDPIPDSPRLTRRLPEAASSSTTSTSVTTTATATTATSGLNSEMGDPTRMYGLEGDQERKILDMGMGGSFSSLLTSNSQYGNIFEGLNTNGSGLKMVSMGGFNEDLNSGGSDQNTGLELQGGGGDGGNSNNNNGGGSGGENYLQSGEWGNSNGWPDLAIYTPGSSF